jgi:uncharacterized membrane protein YjfL (UPF0719 family)
MTTEMDPLLYALLSGAAYLLVATLLVFAAKYINDFLTPYLVDVELAKHDNVALAVSFSGYLAGVAIIYIGALVGPATELALDLIRTGGWALAGIFLLNLSRVINDRLLLSRFSNVKEIIEDQNTGVGAVQAGGYVASALIVAGSIHGQGGGILTMLAFYAAGQVALLIFTWLYDRITPYDLHAELEADNVAAGVAFGGGLIAIGLVLMHACAGNFVSWGANFRQFALEAALILILLPMVRWFLDKAIFAKLDLNHEIAKDRNLGAAFLEATVMISFSAVLVVIAS